MNSESNESEQSSDAPKSELRDSLIEAQMNALADQRSDLEKFIWQLPLAVVTVIGVVFAGVARLAADERFGVPVLAYPAGVGLIIALFGLVILCRMRVQRSMRDNLIRKLLKETSGAEYFMTDGNLFDSWIEERLQGFRKKRGFGRAAFEKFKP